MFLTCKRIAWETYLDVPIGLELRREPGTGTATISQILLGKPRPRSPGPGTVAPGRIGLSYSASRTPDAHAFAARTSVSR